MMDGFQTKKRELTQAKILVSSYGRLFLKGGLPRILLAAGEVIWIFMRVSIRKDLEGERQPARQPFDLR